MARNAVVAETFVLVFYGLYLFGCGQTCLPDSDDLAAVVESSPVVVEGLVEQIQPSANQPSDSGIFDAVLAVRTVFKGRLDRGDDAGSYEWIVVGPFGTWEDCVEEAPAVGGELIFFLDAAGDTSSAEVGLPRFRLLARPRLADPESRAMAKEHGCRPGCATQSKTNAHAHLCADNGYCLNGGTCYVMPTLGLRFCKCTPDFQDVRCQEKQTKIGEKKSPEENPVKEAFFLIVIGSMAALLVLLAFCILLVVLVRWQTTRTKSPGLRGIKYRNINTDPENTLKTVEDSPTTERLPIPATQSNVGVQTDPTIGTSTPGRHDDVVGHHSNGGGKIPPTPGDRTAHDARLSRARQPPGIRDPGPAHHRRAGPNGALKTGELPVSRVPSQNSNVVLVSYRGRDPPTNRDRVASNSSVDGVWIARPALGEDVAAVRGGRASGLNAVVDSTVDSEAQSTAV